ncbi:ankyrin-3-like [Sycon ciliatum]|uniref:ankyrin-3-like n=1 Tax=Sycon ciliatum TaxID=27933 RepID=UPI0020AED1FE
MGVGPSAGEGGGFGTPSRRYEVVSASIPAPAPKLRQNPSEESRSSELFARLLGARRDGHRTSLVGVGNNSTPRAQDLLRAAVLGQASDVDTLLSRLTRRKARRLLVSRNGGRLYPSGSTAVHVCAKLGHVTCLQSILVHCASPELVDLKNFQSYSALLLACQEGRADCVECLLSHGADVASRNAWDETALHLAAQCRKPGRDQCLSVLLRHGANVKAKCSMGWTALHWAAREQHPLCLKILIDAGCPLDSKDQIRVTALSEASREGTALSVQALLEAGARADVRDLGDNLALHEAACGGHSQCVALLVDAGSSVNERGKQWDTALHMAVKGAHMDCVQVLLDHGADPYLSNRDGLNCFQVATSPVPVATPVRYLLREYSDHLNKPDWFGAKSRALDTEDEPKPVHSLQTLARFTIRSHLTTSCSVAVSQLSLPGVMREFLLYRDSPPSHIVSQEEESLSPSQSWLNSPRHYVLR